MVASRPSSTSPPLPPPLALAPPVLHPTPSLSPPLYQLSFLPLTTKRWLNASMFHLGERLSQPQGARACPEILLPRLPVPPPKWTRTAPTRREGGAGGSGRGRVTEAWCSPKRRDSGSAVVYSLAQTPAWDPGVTTRCTDSQTDGEKTAAVSLWRRGAGERGMASLRLARLPRDSSPS